MGFKEISSLPKAFALGIALILAYTIFDKIVWTFFPPAGYEKVYGMAVYSLISFVLIPIIAIVFFEDRASILFFYTAMLLYLGGLEDVLFYVLFLEPIPNELPWLDGTPASLVSNLMGFEHVTSIGLVLNSLLFFSLVMLVWFVLELKK
ncbi:MAG: hypothetical protein DRP00_01465 [Candidatus Aenigmatarchaeota archaeon]|nr:MAG: hypothetical protein DRP00_01465 [Candidatus Aenigmarchaeota archaeon]